MSGARCKRGAYKLKGAVLLEVDEMLGKQHSPEQISGRLGQQNLPKVSPETIYLHVYRDKKAGGELYKNLRFGHKNALLNALELPFTPQEVEDVESNCGSTCITLKNGKVYTLQVVESENEESENHGQPNG